LEFLLWKEVAIQYTHISYLQWTDLTLRHAKDEPVLSRYAPSWIPGARNGIASFRSSQRLKSNVDHLVDLTQNAMHSRIADSAGLKPILDLDILLM